MLLPQCSESAISNYRSRSSGEAKGADNIWTCGSDGYLSVLGKPHWRCAREQYLCIIATVIEVICPYAMIAR